MMKFENTFDIRNIWLNSYFNLIIEHSVATFSGDYRKCNRVYGKIVTIFKRMEKDVGLKSLLIDSALVHENKDVVCFACSDCLCLEYRVEDAIEILRTLAEGGGRESFNASMTLRSFEHNGKTLKRYKNQLSPRIV